MKIESSTDSCRESVLYELQRMNEHVNEYTRERIYYYCNLYISVQAIIQLEVVITNSNKLCPGQPVG